MAPSFGDRGERYKLQIPFDKVLYLYGSAELPTGTACSSSSSMNGPFTSFFKFYFGSFFTETPRISMQDGFVNIESSECDNLGKIYARIFLKDEGYVFTLDDKNISNASDWIESLDPTKYKFTQLFGEKLSVVLYDKDAAAQFKLKYPSVKTTETS